MPAACADAGETGLDEELIEPWGVEDHTNEHAPRLVRVRRLRDLKGAACETRSVSNG